MKIFLILFLITITACSSEKNESLTDYVDPFIGTDYFAHMFPGATLPFSMVQLSPDVYNEGWTYSSGYQYADKSIMGFSHTRFSGSGWIVLGDVLIMPTINDEIQIDPGSRENPDEGYRSRFDHAEEFASPGYYSVQLKDYNIKVELTVTKRVGFHKYTFPDADNAHILIDLGHSLGPLAEEKSHIKIVNKTRIEGYKTSQIGTLYFVAEFSKPFRSFGTWNKGYPKPESGGGFINPYKTAETGREVGVFLDYSTSQNEEILVKVALSHVSIDGAKKNLEAELPGWDFKQVRSEANAAWNKELAKVEIKGGTKEQKQIFYTSLYHSLLAQQIFNDVDGRYFGIDGKVHTAEGYDFYPSFFAWDTYRSEQPLMVLLEPNRANDMIKSIVTKTKNYGWLPAQHAWNNYGQGMVGDHLVPMVADAYVKGIRNYDIDLIYDMMRKKATELPPSPIPPSAARRGLKYYNKLGYIPADRETESIPATLEFAYDDWCLAQLAATLGKKVDSQYFTKKSLNYKNVFDKETVFMRPRMYDGSWLKVCEQAPTIIKNGEHSYYSCFDPLWIGLRPNRHYTESNAWQYLWSVQHDVKGLIDLMGGNKKFIARLDTLFNMSPEVNGPNYVGVVGTIGQYVHGNQPSHHVAYLYNYAGAPWKTQEKIAKIREMLYQTGPRGICGNEDMGSLSSWYVFSALGFYPVAPGQDIYIIGTPLFEEAKIKLSSPYKGKEFIVKANNISSKNIYIQSAELNGKKLEKPWLTHADIVNGGSLIFEMGPTPNKEWGAGPEDSPGLN
ncbi:MAG: glycoside hydrolase family 92 protein [Chlorobi bacterium]|nr:glycoside hydrolase family 92 protein [Chlorobiota bacterium]